MVKSFSIPAESLHTVRLALEVAATFANTTGLHGSEPTARKMRDLLATLPQDEREIAASPSLSQGDLIPGREDEKAIILLVATADDVATAVRGHEAERDEIEGLADNISIDLMKDICRRATDGILGGDSYWEALEAAYGDE